MKASRIRRLFLRGLIVLGCSFAALVAALYAFTLTDAFRNLAREQALALLRSSFRGEIGVDRFAGSIWGDLRLQGVSLRYGGIEVARIPEVALRYSLLPLLHGRIEIAAIELRGAILDLRSDERGQWNVLTALQPPPAAAPSSGGGLPVSITALRLADGRISVTPCRGSGTCLFEQVSLDAAIGVEPSGIDADVRRLSLRFAAEGLPLTWLETSLRYRGADSPARAEVRSLALATQSSRVEITGAVVNPANRRELTTDATLTIDTLAPADVALFAPQWTLGDPLAGTLRLSGPANDLRAHVELAAGKASVRGDLRADVAADTPSGEGNVELHELDLGGAAAGTRVGGIASARLRGSIRGVDLAGARGEAELQVRSAAYGDWRLGDLDTKASLSDRRASLEGTLRGDSGNATWRGSASLGGDERFEVNVAVAHFDPKRFARGVGKGDLTFRASAEGSGFALKRQRSHAVLRLERSRLDNIVFERGNVDLRIAGGRLQVAELSIATPDSQLRANGDVALAADARGRASIEAKVADLAPWLALGGWQGRGSIHLDATVRGAPTDLAGTAKLAATSVSLPQIAIDRGTADLEFRGVGAASPRAKLVASLNGVQSSVSVRSANLEVDLTGARDASGASRFAADTRLAALDLTGRNHRTKLSIDYAPQTITARIAELHLEPPVGNLDLRRPALLSLRGGVVSLEGLELTGPGPKITASGRVSHSGAQRLDVAVEGVPLEWVRSFSKEAPELSGRLSARLALAGTAAAPHLAVSTEASDLRIAGQPYAGLHASLDYRQPAATLDVRFDQDASHALTATARLPLELRWDPDVVMRLAGDLDVTARSNGLSLAFLNAIAPRTLQRVGGEIVLDVASHGPIERPEPRGTIALRDGSAAIAPLGVEVHAATVEVNVAPDAIRIAKLSATAADGRLEGGGTIALAGYAPDRLDLRLAVDRWPAIATSRYRSDLSGEIFCRGTAEAPEVAGKIEVLWAVLRPDLDFLTKAPSKRDPTIQIASANPANPRPTEPLPPAAAPTPDAYRNLSVDVALIIHRNTWINHTNASAELEGQVRATKKLGDDLRLSGAIETVRGWMVFQGRRFTLSHGVVSFTGGSQVDPSLDITADYKTGEYVVHVLIGGTANAPSLKLESDPSLAQADILSVLVFGKPASELNDGQRTDVKQRAQQIATSYAVSEVGQSVTEALGLSGRGIQVEEVSSDRVALGAYVTDRTFVTVAQDVSGRQGQEASIEYDLTRSWGIATSSTSTGSSGADVIWRKRY